MKTLVILTAGPRDFILAMSILALGGGAYLFAFGGEPSSGIFGMLIGCGLLIMAFLYRPIASAYIRRVFWLIACLVYIFVGWRLLSI